MPCHWICKRDWFEIGECVRWGLFIFLALRPFVVKHVFIFSNHLNFFLLKVFRISCFICFFFLVKRNTSHFDTHSHVKKGINQKRSVFVFHDWALQKAYLFFSVKAHSSVCRMLKGTWHIILGEKVHAWSTQISLFSTSFIPYQAVSSVCMWLFKKHYFSVHCCFPGVHSCEIIVKCPSGFCASGIQKKKNHKWHKAAVVQRNKENLCWLFFFFPLWPRDGGHWTTWTYVSIASNFYVR